jgi:hypothetical protein
VARAIEVVDQDRPADADLVAQQPGVGELVVEGVVGVDVPARMGLTGVHEHPRELGVAVGRGIELRTLI